MNYKIHILIICNNKSASCLHILYFALVRYTLYYGALICQPNLAKEMIRLEQVQNRFLSYVTYLLEIEDPHHDYLLIHSNINIPLLSILRSDTDLKFISSILNGALDVSEILSDMKLCVLSYSSRNHNLFYIPPHSTSYG